MENWWKDAPLADQKAQGDSDWWSSAPLADAPKRNVIPGWENGEAEIVDEGNLAERAWKRLAPDKIGETAVGVGESALRLGTQALATIPALPRAAYDLVTKDTKEADKRFGEFVEEYSYSPRTQFGKDLSHDIEQDFLSGLPAIIGAHPTLPLRGKKTKGSPLDDALDAAPVNEPPKPQPTKQAPLDFGPAEELLPSNAPQFGIDHSNNSGMWTVGPDGHPFRADLSMDVPLQENPLQLNLFGNDMVPAAGAERTLHQAMDQMGVENQGKAPIPEAMRKLTNDVPADSNMRGSLIEAEVESGLRAKEGPFSIPKSQRGAIDVQALSEGMKDVYERNIGQLLRLGVTDKDVLGDVKDKIQYGGRVLDRLPSNKSVFSKETVRNELKRADISQPEREAYNRVLDMVKGDKVTAQDLAVGFNMLTEDLVLKPEETQDFASYGLPSIDRETYRRLTRMDDGESFREDDYYSGSTTTLWNLPEHMDVGENNHFGVPNYFGHTRSFVENGTRHVVELQSDLVQRMGKELSPEERTKLEADYKAVEAAHQELIEFPNKGIYVLSDEWVPKILEDLESLSEAAKNLLAAELERQFSSPDQAAAWRETIEFLKSEYADNVATRRQINTAWARATERAEVLARELASDLFAARDVTALKDVSKVWPQRLIREELKRAATRGEQSVRFADADTVAKVEGWPTPGQDHRFSLRYHRQGSDEYNAILREAEKIEAEAAARGHRFKPEHQGIYDRYKKEIAKYLESIGGKHVVDDKGHGWYEVPTTFRKGPVQMFGQRGALMLSPSKKKSALEKILREPLFADVPEPKAVIEGALAEGKDGKGFNMLESGATLAAAKRDSALIKGAARIVQHHQKVADLAHREKVRPVEDALRSLSRKDIADLAKVFKAEMFQQKRIDLASLPLTEKQLLAYTRLRNGFEEALEAQNKAREAAGLEPITRREAYLSSRWRGTFRMPVYEARMRGEEPVWDNSGRPERKLVWYLAADTKMGLNKQLKALKKQFPDLEPGKIHFAKSTSSPGKDAHLLLTTALDVLGRDDPAVQRIKEFAEEQLVDEGRRTLGQMKHSLDKHDVRGFVGDRPGFDPKKDAVDMFQEQLEYMRNAYQWSELQKAGQKIKEIVNNEELLDQQPNNVEYVKEYWKDNLGLGDAQWIRHMEDFLKKQGVPLRAIDSLIGQGKSYFILSKLAVSMGFTAANMIQTSNVIPEIAYMRSKGLKGNPLLALAGPLYYGPLMTAAHYASAHGGTNLVYKTLGDAADGKFLGRAFKYAEDNGITSRSIMDESPLDTQWSIPGKIGRAAGTTLRVPETIVRATAYMTYVQYLRGAKKQFKSDLDLFREAEEAVNRSMVDYRAGERPIAFSKGGSVGKALNTLQTYPFNFWNRFNAYGREMMKGNPLPLVTALALQGYLAGLMGVPGFQEADRLWEWAKTVIPTTWWNKVKDIDFKQMAIEVGGSNLVHGVLSNQLDVALTSRVQAPATPEQMMSPFGVAEDLWKQGSSVASAVMNPTDPIKVGQAAVNVAPAGLQGFVEQNVVPEVTGNTNSQTGERTAFGLNDLADRRGVYTRDAREQSLRNWGLRSQKEIVEKEQAYKGFQREAEVKKRLKDLNDSIYAAARTGQKEKVKELYKIYVEISGRDMSATAIGNQIMEEFSTNLARTSGANKTIDGLKAIKIMKDVVNEHNQGATQ